jgi:hypothetical protein
LDVKIKVLNVVREYPRKHRAGVLRQEQQLEAWKEDAEIGEMRYDKTKRVNKWSFNNFVEARKNKIPLIM